MGKSVTRNPIPGATSGLSTTPCWYYLTFSLFILNPSFYGSSESLVELHGELNQLDSQSGGEYIPISVLWLTFMMNTPIGDTILRLLRPRNETELIVNKELTPFLFGNRSARFYSVNNTKLLPNRCQRPFLKTKNAVFSTGLGDTFIIRIRQQKTNLKQFCLIGLIPATADFQSRCQRLSNCLKLINIYWPWLSFYRILFYVLHLATVGLWDGKQKAL